MRDELATKVWVSTRVRAEGQMQIPGVVGSSGPISVSRALDYHNTSTRTGRRTGPISYKTPVYHVFIRDLVRRTRDNVIEFFESVRGQHDML